MDKLLIINLFVLTISTIAVNTTESIDDTIKNALPEGVTIPPELENLPNVEDVKKLFREKCIKVSGSDAAFEEADQASSTLVTCVQNLVNFTTLPDEIENAKPNGNLDTVFNKYCDKRSNALECVESFSNSIEPCLTLEESNNKVIFTNITKSLLEFICHENGNQIALFIAEEGPECFSAKQEVIQECLNKTMGKYFNGELPSIDNLPTLIFKEENCRDMDKLEACVVNELETCKESTPANLVEALFRFVRKETPCIKWEKVKETKSDGISTKLSINVLIGTWLMSVLAKFIVSCQ